MKTNGSRLPPPRTVAVAINLGDASGRSSLTGILRYVNSGHRWQVKVIGDFERLDGRFVRTAAERGIDGVIAGLPEAAGCFRELLTSELPVSFNVRPETLPVPANRIRRTAFTDVDNASIAQAAVEHFAYRGGFKSVAFVSDRSERTWSAERERTFADHWQKRGISVSRFTCRSDERPMDAKALGRFLAALEKPAAVWCVYDVTAVLVSGVCSDLGLAVPDQVAILGVDNDEVLCRFSAPNLSSVAVDHEELGYRAAEALERLMSGRRPPSAPLLVGRSPRQVIERDSTRRIPPATHLIGNALEFIDANAAAGLTVGDVVRHLGVSRPLADLRFRQVYGKSIGRTIAEARIREIESRLARSDSSFAQIAESCGFSSLSRLAHFFRRETGMTMGEYRVCRGKRPLPRSPSGRLTSPCDAAQRP